MYIRICLSVRCDGAGHRRQPREAELMGTIRNCRVCGREFEPQPANGEAQALGRASADRALRLREGSR